MPRRVVAYVRVAPRERPGGRPSRQAQRDAIEDACARSGWSVVGAEEDVRSGRTLRRPGLQRALAACRTGTADAIVVSRLDRLTYSLADLAELAAASRSGGFALVALDPALDTATEPGRLLAEVLAAASAWRPRGLVRRTERAAGTRGPGRPPSTPPAVAERIRALRAGGATLQAICDDLDAAGIPTPRGGSRWRPSSLRAVLRQHGAPADHTDRGGRS